MRVLIAGCGYVGSALAAALVSDGHEVFGLRRDPEGRIPDGAIPVAADLVAGTGVDAIPGDLDACVSAISADGRSEAAYEAAYVRATTSLQHQLEGKSSALNRWLFVSSTAVYGQKSGEWVDEATSTSPEGFTGRLVLAGEDIVRASGVRHPVVVRLGGIYGPGRTRLLDQVRAGEATCPPEPTYTNRIHRDDAAGILRHLLSLDTPDEIYIGVDSDPAERCEVLRWLAARLGAPPPQPGPGQTRGNKRARNNRILATGYRFLHPTFREGYTAMIDAEAD
jgi:nucleoside-diphosphate-sugar epimerase